MMNTREKILSVAEELIQKMGVSAMSYQHISDVIGIKKASIHHHFPKKDDLIINLLNRCGDIYDGNYHKIINSEFSAVEKLEQLSKLFSKSLKDGKICIFGMLSADVNIINDEAKIALEDSLASTIENFAKVFEQGINDKTLKIESSPKEAAYTFFSAMQGFQIVSRVTMNTEGFDTSVKSLISSWKS